MSQNKNPVSYLLSVVIPSYNCSHLLERAVDSAFALGEVNVEVIVVDDGSTDDTPTQCAKLKKKYPNLLVIRRANGGLSVARNTGINAATGEFIVLLDADDELLPFDLEYFRAFDGDLVRIGVQEIDSGVEKIRAEAPEITTGKSYFEDRLSRFVFYPASWAYVYRRNWLIENGLKFYPNIIHEDNLFTVQALLKATKVGVTQQLFYRYIRREGSITRELHAEKIWKRITSFGIIARELTTLANQNKDVDLRVWIDDVIHNSALLAQKIRSSRGKWLAVWIQLRYMVSYRGYESPGIRWNQRQRLRKLIFEYV